MKKRTTEANPKAATPAERPALASPYELASIAIALAALHGQTKPDLDEAVRLLRLAAVRGRDEKQPTIQFPDIVICSDEASVKENRKAFARMGAHTIVGTKESHPELARQMLEQVKNFEGADSIRPPTHYPASSQTLWRAILKRSPSTRELRAKRAAVVKAVPSLFNLVKQGAHSESSFWIWAKTILPHLPRRGQAKATTKRSRKIGTVGQFTRPKKGQDGQFKK